MDYLMKFSQLKVLHGRKLVNAQGSDFLARISELCLVFVEGAFHWESDYVYPRCVVTFNNSNETYGKMLLPVRPYSNTSEEIGVSAVGGRLCYHHDDGINFNLWEYYLRLEVLNSYCPRFSRRKPLQDVSDVSGDLDCASGDVISYIVNLREKVNPTIINSVVRVLMYMMDVDADSFRPILRINITERSFKGLVNSLEPPPPRSTVDNDFSDYENDDNHPINMEDDPMHMEDILLDLQDD
ncbi:hypothetical protein BC332_32770 [Capsicum chinense]|nr:hypothetical protein BC332_32770 [Capsicum chinense]